MSNYVYYFEASSPYMTLFYPVKPLDRPLSWRVLGEIL